jgi:AcrR family transcriptional regulator
VNQLSVSRPVRRPVQARGQRTRRRLLDAAEAEFGRRGYFETSITDITRRARVAQGTFYVYFHGKRAVFSELVRERNRDLRRTIQEDVRGLVDRRDVERKGFESFFRFIQRHRNMYRIVRQAEFVDPTLFRWYYQRFAEGYVRGLQDGIRAGHIRAMDPELLAYCLMGVADFLGMRWVLWEKSGPNAAVLKEMMEFLLHGLDGEGRRAR